MVMNSVKSIFEISVINAVSEFSILDLQFIEVRAVNSVVNGIERCVMKSRSSDVQLFITFQPLDTDGTEINELFYTIATPGFKNVELSKLLDTVGLPEDEQRCSLIDSWDSGSFATNMILALKHGLRMISTHALAYLEAKAHSNEFSYDLDSATEAWLYEEQRKRLGLNKDSMDD